MRSPDVLGGLAVTSLHDRGRSWYVAHAETGKPAIRGHLRQRRFAEQARADLLATGVDFTRTAQELAEVREQWAAPFLLWSRRAHQDCIDLVTGEHYSDSTHYGQNIPSAANAREIAEALACYVWS